MSDETTYSIDDIEVLEGLEAVRKRPGMYIGELGQSGLQTMLWEIVFGAVHEHLEGKTSTINILIDGPWATIVDDGPGIPVTLKPHSGLSTLETVLTQLIGGCRCGCTYNTRGCCLGHLGPSVINALSAELVAITHQEGRRYRIRFAQGKTSSPLEDLGPSTKQGTVISFKPDPEILEDVEWDLGRIEARARGVAALLPGLKLGFQHHDCTSSNGLADLLGSSGAGAAPAIQLQGEHEGAAVELALRWGAPSPAALSFVSFDACAEGTHLLGLRQGMIWAFRALAGRRPLLGVRPEMFWELLEHDLRFALHVKLHDPRFASQTRSQCLNPEAQVAVRHIVKTQLPKALRAHPVLLDQLLSRFT